MKSPTHPVYDAIANAHKEIAKMMTALDNGKGDLHIKKAKNLKTLDSFLEKAAKKGKPDEILKAISDELKQRQQEHKADYINLQKKFDKDTFDTINLQNFELKIYKYILKAGKSDE